MKVYADSSVLFAWFHANEPAGRAFNTWLTETGADLAWNAVLRAEVRHNLRKLKDSYRRPAWNALRAAEQYRLKIGVDRLGHLLDAADDLSSQYAAECPAGTWDYFHVAAAQAGKCDCFVTGDEAQAELARKAGFAGNRLKFFKTLSR